MMRGSALRAGLACALVLAAGCGGPSAPEPPAIDLTRDLLSTTLDVDLAAREAQARIVFAAAPSRQVSLRIGDLEILDVTAGGRRLEYRIEDADGDPATPARRIDIASGANTEVTLRYRFHAHERFDGWSASGYTFLWPGHCENLFPCKPHPADGQTFGLGLRGVPAGAVAIYPPRIERDAPAYQLAWTVGDYRWRDLGTTPAGTRLRAAHLAGHENAASTGTRHLADEFAWIEAQLGAYPWGAEAATVELAWGPGAYGGMEHHPYWHVASNDFADPLTHTHEAAHGWFGNHVRLACWEDFVLSEGTASYLAAAAAGAIEGEAREAAIWAAYRSALDARTRLADHPARPPGCSADYDVLAIYDVIPYYRGALFHAAVERAIGRPRLLAVLREFVRTHGGRAATVQNLLDAIRVHGHYDAAGEARRYLYELGANA